MAVRCPYCGSEMEYLTTGQVAQLLGLARKTVRAQVKRGRFPGSQLVDGPRSRWEYRIPATAVIALMEEDDG